MVASQFEEARLLQENITSVRVWRLNSATTTEMFARGSVLLTALLISSLSAVAQSAPEKESVAVVELGGETSQTLHGGGTAFGPTVAVEVTPIENWLELEAGVTSLFSSTSTEWDLDLIFKKPWTLSKKAELMAGIGPAWVHTNDPALTANSVSAEAELDFMYWPHAKHRFGWYIEPTYDYNFGRRHQQSLSIAGGLLIAIR